MGNFFQKCDTWIGPCVFLILRKKYADDVQQAVLLFLRTARFNCKHPQPCRTRDVSQRPPWTPVRSWWTLSGAGSSTVVRPRYSGALPCGQRQRLHSVVCHSESSGPAGVWL